jgi:hypothetical protein
VAPLFHGHILVLLLTLGEMGDEVLYGEKSYFEMPSSCHIYPSMGFRVRRLVDVIRPTTARADHGEYIISIHLTYLQEKTYSVCVYIYIYIYILL